MSQKLQQILELLLSEDSAKAEEMLHEYVVSKARAEYESILDESDDEYEDEEEVDEAIDQSNDFEADITDELGDDEGEISSDEFDDVGDDADMGDEFGGEDDMDADLEDKVEDLESELEALKADFDALMNDEMGEPEHDDMDMGDEFGDEEDMGDDMGDEEEFESFDYDLDHDVVEEATKLSNTVAQQPMKGGGLKGSEHDSSNARSMFTNAPKPTTIGKDNVKPVRISDGSEGKKGYTGNDSDKKNPVTSNIKVAHKAASLDHGKGSKMPNTGDDRSNAKSAIPRK